MRQAILTAQTRADDYTLQITGQSPNLRRTSNIPNSHVAGGRTRRGGFWCFRRMGTLGNF